MHTCSTKLHFSEGEADTLTHTMSGLHFLGGDRNEKKTDLGSRTGEAGGVCQNNERGRCRVV